MAKQEFSFNGVITHLGDIRSGITQRTNKEWKMQDIVIEEQGEEYPQFLKGTLSKYAIDKANYKVGDTVSAKFELKKNTYNGKEFTVINVGVLFVHNNSSSGTPQQPMQQHQQQQTAAPQSNYANNAAQETDDLPF